MPKGLTFLPSLAFAAVMALPLAAETKPDADTVIARVNGEEITLGHVIATAAAREAENLSDILTNSPVITINLNKINKL